MTLPRHRTALLVAALASVAAVVVPTTAATGAGSICVALVVDPGTLGGSVQSGCVTVPRGATGYDVLHAGGHSFTICSNGVLGTIDGRPADGCRVKDNTHYWGYWHRAPGSSSWTYSTEGGGTYQPRNASTEGWVWEDGGSAQPPTNVPYSRICTSTPTPTPAPTRHRSSPPVTQPTATHQAPAAAGSSSGSPAAATPSGSTSPTPRGSPTATPTPSATPSTAAPPVAASPGAAPLSQPAGPSNGPPVGLLVGVAVVALLGLVAGLRMRRSGA